MKRHAKTNKEYAEQYNCSVKTIQRWRAVGYDLDNEAETKARIEAAHRTPTAFAGGDLADWKKRKIELECARIELANAVARGEYTHNSEIRADLARIGQATRAALVRMESDLPGVLVGLDEAAIQIKIRAYVDAVSESLHDSLNPLYQI